MQLEIITVDKIIELILIDHVSVALMQMTCCPLTNELSE